MLKSLRQRFPFNDLTWIYSTWLQKTVESICHALNIEHHHAPISRRLCVIPPLVTMPCDYQLASNLKHQGPIWVGSKSHPLIVLTQLFFCRTTPTNQVSHFGSTHQIQEKPFFWVSTYVFVCLFWKYINSMSCALQPTTIIWKKNKKKNPLQISKEQCQLIKYHQSCYHALDCSAITPP